MKDLPENHEQVAGNGLLHRRMFLAGSAAAAMGAGFPLALNHRRMAREETPLPVRTA